MQTLDFFAPIVDDPYQYGAIAAANAMNDVYAMGGDVLLALNIAAFPEDLPLSVVAAILEGGADKVSEAGGVIAGGHTIIDAEPKYGLCVTGLVEPARVRTNASAETGDVVLLTKPIGTRRPDHGDPRAQRQRVAPSGSGGTDDDAGQNRGGGDTRLRRACDDGRQRLWNGGAPLRDRHE